MLKLIAFHCVNVTIIAPIPIVKFCYYQKKKKRKEKTKPHLEHISIYKYVIYHGIIRIIIGRHYQLPSTGFCAIIFSF